MKVLLPVVNDKDLAGWARKLTVALTGAFEIINPSVRPGQIILWHPTATMPYGGYLQANGATYPAATYPALARVYPESTPGNFTVPNVTAPAGTTAWVKT